MNDQSDHPEQILDLVLEALENAVKQEGETRLIQRGRSNPGLLSGRKSKARTAAVEQCLKPELDLFHVREEVEEVGKKKKQETVHFVTITGRGIEVLFDLTPAERCESLLEEVAPPHKEAAFDACLNATERGLSRISAERRAAQEREAHLFGYLSRITQERLEQIRTDRDALEKAFQAVENFHKQLVPDAQPAERRDQSAPDTPRAERQPGVRPTATTEEELDFQRDQCEDLIFAWQDATDPEVRAALEPVMFNAGLEMVGEAGETVEFDGRQHLAQDSLEPGDRAVVCEPGWRLVNSRGNYLIVRASVKQPSSQEKVLTHAGDDQH